TTLGEMAAGVAHELNQPLTVIGTGAIFLLKRLKKDQTIAPDVALEVADEILAQVERASRIINHLREFGRKAEVARSKIDINQPIRGVFGLLGQQLKIRNITAETDLAPELPTIWADVNRLEQVFVNLVINARDAIEQRRAQAAGQFDGRIEVRSFVENGQVVVTVKDNGAGIASQDKDRILEPFFTTKEVGHGTGLGLSISYGIVADYKGSIEVDSQLDQGTTFRLAFPAAKEESS
ncbi:MAG: PAS domain-containing sensor histidine kinase, partial [Deltaproteobacteria bacterium]|nr:PAS domain-containing sensor histidine kinase [Deltaproteobacteria bacterium]